MFRSMLMASGLAALVAASYLGTTAVANAGGYIETDFVVGGKNADPGTKTLTDANGVVHSAQIFDPDLVNAWGLTESTTSPFWVSDNGSGKSTLYNVPSGTPLTATKNARVVSIPSPGDPLGASGTPTGAAWNPTSGGPVGSQEFKIPGYLFTGVSPGNCSFTTAVATFLFDTEDGTIVGWNSNLYPTLALCEGATALGRNNTAIIAVDNSARGQGGGQGVGTGKGKGNGLGAVYKGLAIATDAHGATFLYAANFRAGRVEIYNGTFALVDTFTDRKVPPRYAPFNVVPVNVNGNLQLFVTFAVQDADRHDDVAGQGNGIVDTFDLSGNMLQRFAEHGGLNSPWGMALTPAGFGDLGGKLWIGNFGDGKINAFDPGTGASVGTVNQSTGKPVVIDGLWALKFGNGGNGGSSQTLYFTAGPNGEQSGLFGALSPSP
jgi:uncharacterized protein (TIGR03118 family)